MNTLGGTLLAVIHAGRGRILPLLLLFCAGLLLHRIEQTPLLGMREAQFDHFQRLMPRQRDAEPVIVVGIDSQSLVRHGQWPWPRSLLARLIDKIQAGKPLALGIDIVFSEPDRFSPEVLAEHLPILSDSLKNSLPDPDLELTRALAGSPVILAIVGLDRDLPGSRQPARPLPKFLQNPERDAPLPHFSAALSSRPVLEKGAAGEGLINADVGLMISDKDRGVLRQVPTLGFVNDLPFLTLPMEMIRQALGEAGELILESNPHGMSALRIGDYRLPTQRDGKLLLHFGRSSSNYYLSAADVLAGLHPPELFAGRFVIVGFNSAGLQDRIITPLGESLPGIDVHAQVIESLLAGQALQRPWWMLQVELAGLIVGGLLLIAIVPRLKAHYAVFAFICLTLLLIAVGHMAFFAGQWLFDGATSALLLVPVFIALLGNTLIEAERQRRAAEGLLQASREEAARAAGELAAARRIQMGLLPDPAKLFANERRFSLAALLEPAQAVGGDYYDCFMLDAQRLCLAIGDVAGKGLPASLFMAISKSLSGTLTRRQDDLGLALREIETELARENPESLFVTTFIAILDVASGELHYSCAGHDAPWILRNGKLARIDTSEHAGPPLCAMGDYPFTAGRTRLAHGDLLCLFTDGVTEAMNRQNFPFGNERLLNAILAAETTDLEEMIKGLRDSVRRFEAGQTPVDDLTLLLMRWNGPVLNER